LATDQKAGGSTPPGRILASEPGSRDTSGRELGTPGPPSPNLVRLVIRGARLGAMLATVPVLIGSCTPKAGSTTPETPQTSVRVVNRNFLDMDIYVLISGEPSRLGTVTGLTTQVLALPSGFVQAPTEVRFRASPVGSRASALSMGVYATPGDTLQLEIPNGPF
jgi:hypothetical protein